MSIEHERLEPRPNRIGWSSLVQARSVLLRSHRNVHMHGTRRRSALACSACKSDRHVAPADNLAKTGFCEDCLQSSRSRVELGGES